MNKLKITNFPPLDYAANEALNTLCTNLSFTGQNQRKLLLTSCSASEGKSFVSMNMLRTLTKLGYSVALVDTDLRRSVIKSKYGIKFDKKESNLGLAHYLAGMTDSVDDVLYETDMAGAYMIPVGREVSNPLPLFNTDRLPKLLNYLDEKLDFVIVDTAPIGTVIDAAKVAQHCDGALIVVSYDKVPRKELIETKNLIEQTGCPVLGTVLNQVNMADIAAKKYYHGYYNKYYGKKK